MNSGIEESRKHKELEMTIKEARAIIRQAFYSYLDERVVIDSENDKKAFRFYHKYVNEIINTDSFRSVPLTDESRNKMTWSFYLMLDGMFFAC